ncbi:autotransporter domain-containing protein [Methylobacterium sp. C25]|uniref:autotransporter family protein n=1 Tax=Methylobacterium sp. C25 TaxID=2721622 RepID=UPI001F3B0336|nr:autotransporter outer membrane beta-barrel domain-containing protein [Methylobacterium sp. C25]MCE4222572.1 autotransporter domain-containing protein [Methylobacterium sp. C25]
MTCADTTATGFVAPAGVTGLTVNIQQGATISGSTQTGGSGANLAFSNVRVNDGSVVNNNGTISITTPKNRDNFGVNLYGSNVTLNNNGTISGAATTIGNTQRLYGVYVSADGVPAGTEFDDVRVVNNNSISVSQSGNGRAIGIYAGEDIDELTIVNNGTITATRAATATQTTQSVAGVDSDDDVDSFTLRNAGKITASGANTRAVNGRASSFTVINSGTIENLSTAAGSAAIATYAANVVQPYNTSITNTATGIINGDIRNTDVDQQTAASAVVNRRNGQLTNDGTINGNLFFGQGNQTIANNGKISGNITFLDVGQAGLVPGSVNTVTLGTDSVIGGNITARGLGANSLILMDVAGGAGNGGGGGDDDDDDDDDDVVAAAPAAAATGSGHGRLTSNVSGFSSLTVTSGTWTLAAGSTQTFSQGAAVNGGTLYVDSTLNANTTVGEEGTLGGNGRINGRVSNFGVVMPGSDVTPYGTLTVAGAYRQDDDARLAVNVKADGTSAKLQVNGTATLAGDVQLVGAAGTYVPGTRYTVLNATGGFNNSRFDTVSKIGLPTLLAPVATTEGNTIVLTLQQQSFGVLAQTPNQRSVAPSFDALLAGNTAALTYIDNQSDRAVIGILDRVAGQGYASVADPQFRAGRAFTDSLMTRAYSGVFEAGATGFTLPPATYAADMPNRGPVPEPRFVEATRGYGVWATGYGQTGNVAATVANSGRNETIGGFAAGVDMHPSAGTFLGIAAGYGSVDVSLRQTGERAHTDNAQVGLYGGIGSGPLYATAAVGYAHVDGRMTRSLAGLQALQPGGARGKLTGDQFLSAGEAGYRYTYARDASVTPFIGFQVSTFSQDRVSETGLGPFNLNVAAKDFLSARSQIGARIEHFAEIGGRPVTFAIKGAYVHDFADVDRTIQSSFALVPALPFTVQGRRLDRDRALVGAGLNAVLAPGWTGFVNYDAEVATTDTIQAGRAGARYSF